MVDHPSSGTQRGRIDAENVDGVLEIAKRPSRYDETLEVGGVVDYAVLTADVVVDGVEVGGEGEGAVDGDEGIAGEEDAVERARTLQVSNRICDYDISGEEDKTVVGQGLKLLDEGDGGCGEEYRSGLFMRGKSWREMKRTGMELR